MAVSTVGGAMVRDLESGVDGPILPEVPDAFDDGSVLIMVSAVPSTLFWTKDIEALLPR